jgi:S-DNA-T family DNA segregation ATPase FtsK/SpoIIIE
MNEAKGNTGLARGVMWSVLALDGFMLLFTMCTGTTNNNGIESSLLLFLAVITGLAAWYAIQAGLFFELRLEYRWKKTCAGLGGNFVGEGRPRLQPGLSYDFYGSAKKTKVVRDKKYPKLRQVRGNREAWTAVIRPFYGQTLDDYTKNAPSFALAFNNKVSFDKTDTGLIRIRCGQLQVPDMYAYPVERLAEPAAVTNLAAIPMARTVDGHPFYLAIEGNHLLIVGRTGSGKNSWTWSLVFGLAQARQAGIVRLWGLDPKRVELAYGRECWDEYADTVEDMLTLLEKAENDMHERNMQLKGNARKVTISKETPLNVIVIDEYAYLSAAVDEKTRKRAQRVIRSVAWLGRSAGYSLVACSQDPRKEVLTERDYFPTKVALGMEAPMVDLVLGNGAHDTYGAHCEQIPLREAGAGSAYVKDELTNEMVLVRAAWCSDQAIRMMLANPQAFDVAYDEPLRQYEQGYGGQQQY